MSPNTVSTSQNPAVQPFPSHLDKDLKHLDKLLENLPQTLPFVETTSQYVFDLDPLAIEDEGLGYAVNRCLEVAFSTYKSTAGAVALTERGPHWKHLVAFLRSNAKKMLTPADREFYIDRWVTRLIDAAKEAGAKIPNKRRARSPAENAPQAKLRFRAATEVIEVSSDSESSSPLPVVATRLESPSAQEHAEKATTSRIPDLQVPPSLRHAFQSQASNGATASASKPKQQSMWDFVQKATVKEVLEIQNRVTERYGVDPMVAKAEEARLKQLKKEEKLKQNRVRQQRFRDRTRARKAGKSGGKKSKEVVLGVDGPSQVIIGVAELSRAKLQGSGHGPGWKTERNGRKGGVAQKRHVRVNWYHPFLWRHINKIAPKVSWSPQQIVRYLRLHYPELFSTLHRGTVSKWISKNDPSRWSNATLKNVERRSTLAGTGRVGILARYPNMVEEIKVKMEDLRTAGVTISGLLTRSIFLSIIKDRQPDLLKTFRCSTHFVYQFLESTMDWTFRKGTRAAAHIPADAQIQCERTFFRMVHLISYYDIPPGLVINMDQTGIIILATHNQTFEKKGSRQVDIVGKNEKRAFTLCVSTTAAGDVLPFQQVWSGKTDKSLPDSSAALMDEAKKLGFDFAVSDSGTSHFSTLKTMKEWIVKILKPYIDAYITDHNLEPDQKAILYIDCYPVHIGKDFRQFVFSDYPHIFLIFVPANCTGIFQPADVGVQRILKQFIRQEMLEFLVDAHSTQMAAGLSAENVKITTSYPILRNASVKPIVNLFNFLSGSAGREIIQRAWQKSIVKEWNLGGDCLTSLASKRACRRYIEADDILRTEIQTKLDQLQITGAEPIDDFGVGDADESEIPLSVMIQHEFQLDHGTTGTGTQTRSFCVRDDEVDIEGEQFVPIAAPEYIWAYTMDGQSFSENLPTM
ncbi:hypothetical protein CVT24_000890 [Panaeolus cyanescens]|uniref:DDE-1 domain-containing protein n=1 Tax=Panaeolus cyanescens TaxID=181874 RepID=A0A409YTD2_9AGAR|nr:hypothetical protein CVT24_000890 [Panaeolus cyanescens]